MTSNQIAHRIEAMERELAHLKSAVGTKKPRSVRWWEQIAGSFAGDPAFLEAAKLGRTYRQGQRKTKRRAKK